MSETTELVFFIDRSLGRKLPQMLRNAGATIEIHDERFRQDTPDIEWLAEVGRYNWVVLTKDEKIGYRTPEQIAVAAANVRLFVLACGNLSAQEMGAILLKALESIRQFAKHNPAPFIAKIYQSGEVKEWKNRNILFKKLGNNRG